MLTLPQPMAAWATTLECLPVELAKVMGPWLGRLDALLGRLSASSSLHGEPDGYGELSKRGSYERLVMAEWAIANAAPDEFLRRAANAEHLFFSIQRRAPKVERRTIALFDAGPMQLGSPRLAQLAILLVLERRLARTGAGFEWGILQDSERRRHTGQLDAAAVERFFASRTSQMPGVEDVAAWQNGLNGFEIIIVGASHSHCAIQPDPNGSYISIDERASHGTLLVRAGRKQMGAHVELLLPTAAVCARLIRAPIVVSTAAEPTDAQLETDRGIVLTGGRVFGHQKGGGVIAWHVPNSQNAVPGKTRRVFIQEGDVPVAVAKRGKRLIVVSRNDRGYRISGLQRYAFEVPEKNDAGSGHGGALREACVLGDSVYMVDEQGQLLLLAQREEAAVRLGSCAGVASVMPNSRRPQVWAMCHSIGDFRRALVRFGADSSQPELIAAFAGDGDLTTYFGNTLSSNPVVAVRQKPGRWLLLEGEGAKPRIELHMPADVTVIGVTRAYSAEGSEPALIILDPDQHSISVVSMHASYTLPRSGSAITHAYSSTTDDIVAYQSLHRSLNVLSLSRKTEIRSLRLAR